MLGDSEAPSLIRGGPWATFEKTVGLIRGDGAPVVGRIVFLALLLWLPLVILSYPVE
jgi:hypothetical protein